MTAVLALALALPGPGCDVAAVRGPDKLSSTHHLGVGRVSTTADEQLVEVELRVDPPESDGEAVSWTLKNTGQVTLGYGHAFELERKRSDGWNGIDVNAAFTLELRFLSPGETSEPEVIEVFEKSARNVVPGPPRELKAGLYRLTTDVEIQAEPERTYRVAARFRIVAPASP